MSGLWQVYGSPPPTRVFMSKLAARWYAWRLRRFGIRTTLHHDSDER